MTGWDRRFVVVFFGVYLLWIVPLLIMLNLANLRTIYPDIVIALWLVLYLGLFNLSGLLLYRFLEPTYTRLGNKGLNSLYWPTLIVVGIFGVLYVHVQSRQISAGLYLAYLLAATANLAIVLLLSKRDLVTYYRRLRNRHS